MSEEHPFYGKSIARKQEQEYIHAIVSRFKQKTASPELAEEIYNALMREKHMGRIHIPFKVLLQKDETGHRPDYIDVVLDSKV